MKRERKRRRHRTGFPSLITKRLNGGRKKGKKKWVGGEVNERGGKGERGKRKKKKEQRKKREGEKREEVGGKKEGTGRR